jgi:hypothetical protein
LDSKVELITCGGVNEIGGNALFLEYNVFYKSFININPANLNPIRMDNPQFFDKFIKEFWNRYFNSTEVLKNPIQIITF